MAIVSLLFMDSAFALSDADYMKFTQESPAFAQADARLNAAWKQRKSGLSKAEYQTLLREQRVWLKKRDEIAQTVRSAKEGRSKEACE